ncbi:pseudo-response regulator 5 [Raphanus sativus]|nr:pseudo-response regulator 5 [Raphanus sativus]
MSDEVFEVTVVEKPAEAAGGKSARRRTRKKEAAEGGDGLVKWERFLPKIALRVLLVEADDSTRHIISALLRKCSYRVAAVPDGLKAWEMLKGNPESIDLILTEVDLPSISGYALLTLIMEHDICKNIPVLMMSTQDSVNTVYKCMLKGASDYLVKPLRRNELRNLWQHVWRRRQGEESADVPRDSSKEAIDFMGALFRRNGEESVTKYESRIELDLSLRRRPNQSSGDRRPSLHPSIGSAFTRYVHKPPLQTECSVSPLVSDQRKNVAASGDGNIVVTNHYNSSEPTPSAPIKSIQFTGAYVAPASLSPTPRSVSPHEYSSMFHPVNGDNKPEGLQEQDVEERRNVSSATERSATGNHCSTSYIDYHHQQSLGKTLQSVREAALNKFRMKRKDRCFDKKVRYESRKKLAEQRPRVKGQFVRQVQSAETSTQAAPQ